MLCQLLVVLLPSVKLEFHNITVVTLDLFVVAYVDLISALRNQSHIVRNHNHTSLE